MYLMTTILTGRSSHGKEQNKPLGFTHHNAALPFLSRSFARPHLSDLLRALTHRLATHNCVF